MLSYIILASTRPSVVYAFTNSDSVGKGIVVLLLISSVFTWTVMIDKGMALIRARQSSNRFLARFRSNKKHIASLQLISEGNRDSGPLGAIYSAGVKRLLEFYEADPRSIQYSSALVTNPSRLTDEQYNAIEAVMEREVSSQIQDLETRIGFLATLVSVSPFCGLFGTVWGVMLAFCGIAAAGKSDFTALAPGVAGALLTTVAGLIVAIPSLVGYNLLTGTIRNITISMDNFSAEFMVKLKLEQLDLLQAERKAREEKETKVGVNNQSPATHAPAQQPVRAFVLPRPQPMPVTMPTPNMVSSTSQPPAPWGLTPMPTSQLSPTPPPTPTTAPKVIATPPPTPTTVPKVIATPPAPAPDPVAVTSTVPPDSVPTSTEINKLDPGIPTPPTENQPSLDSTDTSLPQQPMLPGTELESDSVKAE